MKSLFFLFIFLLSLSSFAKEGGNGGGVVICGKKIELFDFYEGRSPRGHNLKVWKVRKDLSMNEYLKLAFGHMKKDIPEVAPLVEKVVHNLLSMPAYKLFTDGPIDIIHDADTSVIAEGCEYVQIARWSEFPEKISIRRDLFERLDNMGRAGLFIHEAIYRLSRNSSVAKGNSNQVREVVARIFSPETLTKNDAEVIFNLKSMIEATRSICDASLEKITHINAMKTGASPDILKNLDEMTRKTADTCLRKCLDPEVRKICEDNI